MNLFKFLEIIGFWVLGFVLFLIFLFSAFVFLFAIVGLIMLPIVLCVVCGNIVYILLYAIAGIPILFYMFKNVY